MHFAQWANLKFLLYFNRTLPPGTQSPLLPGTPWYPVTLLTGYFAVPGQNYYWIPPLPGSHSYWEPPSIQSPLLSGTPSLFLPGTRYIRYRVYLVPGIANTRYDLFFHGFTYLDWVYQVPITHIGNGAGFWYIVKGTNAFKTVCFVFAVISQQYVWQKAMCAPALSNTRVALTVLPNMV